MSDVSATATSVREEGASWTARLAREIRGTWCSDQLDLVRGLAALAVCLLHLRDLFFLDYVDLQNPGPIVTAFYVLGNFGHQAVVLFFVLSGYFISSTIARSLEAASWSWRSYLIQRLARLGIVLLPALALTGILDHLGIALFGLGHNYVGDGTVYIADPGLVERMQPGVLVGNALFLQSIFTPTFGSNSPLWSLSYEFWFYIFFPVLLLAIRPGKRWPTVLVLPIVLALCVVRHGLAFYFLIWLMGCAAGSLPPVRLLAGDRRAKGLAWCGLLACAAVLASVWFGRLGVLSSDFALGLAFSMALYALLQVRARSQNGIGTRGARILAGFSYTLYAVHLPVLFILRAWLVPNGRWTPTAAHLGGGLAVLFVVLSLAYAFSRVTEARTARVRDALFKLVRVARVERTNARS